MIDFKTYYSLFESVAAEPVSLIMEGGNAGHMSHIIDDKSMTFGELKKMLREVFSGKLELTTKVDGQNAFITYKNGHIGLSRNKATIKNPMTIEDAAERFAGRGEIEKAFITSMKAMEKGLKQAYSEEELNSIFNNGNNFLNIEILYPATKNVIDYGNRAKLVLHALVSYDENSKVIDSDTSIVNDIYNKLEEHDALEPEGFEISGPIFTGIKDIVKSSNDVEDAIKELDTILSDNGLTDSNTISDLIHNGFKKELVEEFNKVGIAIDSDANKDIFAMLLARFADGDKSNNMRNIVKLSKDLGLPQDEFLSVLGYFNNEAPKIYAKIIEDLDVAMAKAAANLLLNLSAFVTASPDESVNALKKDLDTALYQLKNYPDKMQKLGKHIRKLQAIGMDKIVPEEGVVFRYGDQVFKLTGAFGPINAILGELKY